MSNAVPVIRQDDEGERFWFAGGGIFTMKATTAETGGSFTMWEDHVVRGKTTPLHVHPHEESFYVISGSIRLYLDGATQDLRAGGFAIVPRDVAHAFGELLRALDLGIDDRAEQQRDVRQPQPDEQDDRRRE